MSGDMYVALYVKYVHVETPVAQHMIHIARRTLSDVRTTYTI